MTGKIEQGLRKNRIFFENLLTYLAVLTYYKGSLTTSGKLRQCWRSIRGRRLNGVPRFLCDPVFFILLLEYFPPSHGFYRKVRPRQDIIFVFINDDNVAEIV